MDSTQIHAMSSTRKNGGITKFRKAVSLIQLVLRAFSRRIAIHPTWDKNPVIPLDTGLPSPSRHKHKPDLQELTQPGALKALTNRIHQRLQLQSNAAVASTQTVPCVATREEDLLPLKVQRILTDSSWTRSSKTIELVFRTLQSYEAFKDYPPHIQKQLCRVGWYQRVEAGRIIFREGQQPSSFYLILSGSVKVLVKASGGYDEVIQTVKSGQFFGDTAISKRQLRTSTCVASSTAEFLVISKSDYIDLSLRQSRLSYQRAKHFAFCKTITELKYFPLDELQSQPDLCSVKYFRSNAVVVKDSTKCDWVYVIMTGSCRVVKRFIDSNEFERSSTQFTEPRGLNKRASFSKVSESGLVGSGFRSSKTLMGATDEPSDHRRKIRHFHTLPNMQQALEAKQTIQYQPSHPSKQFLVQLQMLHPKDTFGLSSILHNSEPSITLVSNGADIVMISKDFLVRHMTEVLKVKLQRKVMQYPSEEAMRKRIRDHNTWKSYKHSMVHQARSRQVSL